MRPLRTLVCLSILCFGSVALAADAKLAIHEWGTFTSLQDETGRSIGGINSDDEPLPDFVRTRESSVVRDSPGFNDRLFKGIIPLHPDVTMRLETPVMYFYPPKDAKLPMTIDVSVDFHGGWLTQYYPGALATLPGFDTRLHAGKITEETTGNLTWKKLAVGTNTEGPTTDSKIWLAPRQVNAVSLTSVGGESEKYLFYRGVGHLDSPLKVLSKGFEGTYIFGRARWTDSMTPSETTVRHLWLLSVRPDGKVAMRTFAPRYLVPAKNDPGKAEPTSFAESDYSASHLSDLRQLMKEAIVADGLYDDEAEAMLNTWQESYFKSPGLRLFYLVPRAWTDSVLPLKVSVPADITRVMVGRIELVTPRQRELIQLMTKADLTTDAKSRAEADLGRFADALLADGQRDR